MRMLIVPPFPATQLQFLQKKPSLIPVKVVYRIPVDDLGECDLCYIDSASNFSGAKENVQL